MLNIIITPNLLINQQHVHKSYLIWVFSVGYALNMSNSDNGLAICA